MGSKPAKVVAVAVVATAVVVVAGVIAGPVGVAGALPGAVGMVVNEINRNTRLEVGTPQFNTWKELPTTLQFKLYMFNVTNPHEIEHRGAIPVVHELGPLIYNEELHNENVEGKEDNDTLQYNRNLTMKFQRSRSAFGEDFNLTLLNLPLQWILQKEEEDELPRVVQGIGVDQLLPEIFGRDGMFITMPIKKLFFGGYKFCDIEDPEPKERMFRSARAFEKQAMNAAKKEFCKLVGQALSNNPTINVKGEHLKFSLLKHTGTNGQFEISSGMKDIKKLGQIKAWKGKSYLDTWLGGPNSICNQLKGTDSTIYPPGIYTWNSNKSTVFIFSPSQCRTFKLTIKGDVGFAGIPGVKAVMGPENMENEGENSCYCIRKTRNLAGNNNCFPRGFCDMGNCLQSPIILSFPHMLWADKAYASTVQGLQPNEENHVSFVSLEPNTGTLLQSRKRLQLNVPVRPIDAVQATHNMPAAMLPIFWVEEDFDLRDKRANKVKTDYLYKMYWIGVAIYAVIGTGLIGITATSAYLLFRRF